jgi:hypothetical protein
MHGTLTVESEAEKEALHLPLPEVAKPAGDSDQPKPFLKKSGGRYNITNLPQWKKPRGIFKYDNSMTGCFIENRGRQIIRQPFDLIITDFIWRRWMASIWSRY